MSKYFNQTQKARPGAPPRLDDDPVDVREMLESLKRSLGVETESAEMCLGPCGKPQLGQDDSAHRGLGQGDCSPAALEAYRGLRSRLLRIQAKSGLRTIAITSSVPGEGKTLATMNLGLCFAQLPQQKVLVIDGDLSSRRLSSLLGQRTQPGLAEILAGEATPEGVIVATDHKNLFVLPAGKGSSPPPELFTGFPWREFFGTCSEMFTIILVDAPSTFPLADSELISAACDGIVLVARARDGRRDPLQKAASTLDPGKFIDVVFSSTEANAKDYDSYGYGYGQS